MINLMAKIFNKYPDQLLILSANDTKLFFEALSNMSLPSPKLLNAVAKYKKNIAQQEI